MDIQRLRNITTRILHTEMKHVYQDLEFLTGEQGLMTHMLPRVAIAIEPWLREKVTDVRFWDEKHDPEHVGEFDIEPMNTEAREEAFERYKAMPNPLAGKKTIVIHTGA